ncbi:CocE/NonD family hydrolase [Neorhizobium petrolearium]|uniref:CocE/NonD family hydrolase n=1 Tax=Neorhizobium petrolearium TaxID=515361 RepID=A0ABY8M9P2_9HYPH|nr:CocE/NonD family hydrolase [Neorhizobium petrolearium]MCC2611839.1 CocE/NonD family hydrolase [Neorhizobium petrolearium]WGI71265.1 CocE/NonD family hydrolase [Neorhizobium petrolearium]
MHHRTPHDVIGPERAELVLRDGIVLVADIYRPANEGLYPVLLMRQPYGRAIASTVVLAHPCWYASHGYIVVIQDVRGCGDSGGDFEAFVNEMEDGAQSLDWAASLPGCSGKLGLYGFSYQAMTQYLALAGKGRRPDAIAPAMASWMPRDDWAYEGSAFRLGLNVSWAAQMAKLKAARNDDGETYSTIDGAADDLALRDLLIARPDLSHLGKWIEDDETYWSKISPGVLLRDNPLDIPAFHTGGWADFFLEGTWAADAAFRRKNLQTSHLVIGPWTHAPWNRMSGGTDMGPEAEFPVDRAQIAFFDFYLKGKGDRPATARLFDMGLRRWRTLPSLPPTADTAFFLASSGLAAAMISDGRLDTGPSSPAGDTFVHDPFRPTPLVGGHLGTPAGFADRSAFDNRADVAVYTTLPFDAATTFIGKAAAEIEIASRSLGCDVCATLSLVGPDGAAKVISTGYARIDDAHRALARISLRSICLSVPVGFRLRLSLQGAAAPAFEIHPGNGAFAPAPAIACRPIPISIHHGGAAGSRLIMPRVSDDVA